MINNGKITNFARWEFYTFVSLVKPIELQHCIWTSTLTCLFPQTSPSSWPTTPSTTHGRGTQSTSAATWCPTRRPLCCGRGSGSPSRPRPPPTPGCTRPRASQCWRWVQPSQVLQSSLRVSHSLARCCFFFFFFKCYCFQSFIHPLHFFWPWQALMPFQEPAVCENDETMAAKSHKSYR